MVMHGKTFADYSYLYQLVAPMLEQLVWWANVLRPGRDRLEGKPPAKASPP
jgi:hypothetical protein